METAKLAFSGISVVIPCLNEESSIVQVIESVRQGLEKSGLPGEVVVVDNGSTDRSVELAEAAGARVVHEQKKGYGSALRCGFRNARHDILVMGDADMTYDFTKLHELTSPIVAGEAEFVIGNRMANVRPGAMPLLHQYLGTPMMALFLKIMLHNNSVRDPNCGMRAITKDAYKRLRCVTTGMEFASEMIVQAIRNKVRCAERDIVYHPRVGESKLRSFQDGWRHLRFMMLYSPTMILILPGVIAWLIGWLMVAPIAFGPIVVHGRVVDIHFMIMGGLLNIVSGQILSIGILAKAYAHLSGLRHDPFVAWLYRWFTFEKATAVGVALFVPGLIVSILVVLGWAISGFGALNQARPLFFALLCVVNGVVIALSSYLLSIMALPRDFEAEDSEPPR